MPSGPRKLIISFSPMQALIVKVVGPLKECWGKINGIHFGSVLGSFLKGGLASSSFKELWVCELAHIWRSIGES